MIGAEHERALVQHRAQLRLRLAQLARLAERERKIVPRDERASVVRAKRGAVGGERLAVELERGAVLAERLVREREVVQPARQRRMPPADRLPAELDARRRRVARACVVAGRVRSARRLLQRADARVRLVGRRRLSREPSRPGAPGEPAR